MEVGNRKSFCLYRTTTFQNSGVQVSFILDFLLLALSGHLRAICIQNHPLYQGYALQGCFGSFKQPALHLVFTPPRLSFLGSLKRLGSKCISNRANSWTHRAKEPSGEGLLRLLVSELLKQIPHVSCQACGNMDDLWCICST